MDLRERAISGVKWSGFASGSQQILQVIVTIILARLLAPEDFGILTMALVFTGLIMVFNDFGTGSAVIQNQNMTDDDLSSIFWFNVLIGIIATLLTIAISPLIAAFYEKDILAPLLSLMAFSFLFTSLSVVQRSLLMKQMDFKRVSIVEITSAALSGAVAITLAYKGFGVWSLVWQGLVATITTTFLLWVITRWRPRLKFYKGSVRSVMGFSLNLLGFSVVNYFSRNVDYLLIGKFLGADQLGYYALAYRLMLYPLQNISNVVTRVLFPAFSIIQHDNENFRDAYLKSTRYIAFITFPMMFGLFAVANEFVLTLFGTKWEPTIFLVKVLCFVGMWQSIGSTVRQIYMAKGRTDWMFRWGMLEALLVTIAIIIGLQWEIKGVVISYAIITTVLVYPLFLIPFKLIDLKIKTFIYNFKHEFLASVIMFIVLFTSIVMQHYFFVNSITILATNVVLGVAVYLMITRIINKETYREIQSMVWNKKGNHLL